MKTAALTIPEVALIGATRAMLGLGIGFLVADHLEAHDRKIVGRALLAIGVFSTFPLVADVFSKLECSRHRGSTSGSPKSAQRWPAMV